ncbi:MAG: alpha/beta hydrolase [Gemmatimonadetes bacterium]|nr:alpha/beta hydrolase [Gemmatimonadota bacterium]
MQSRGYRFPLALGVLFAAGCVPSRGTTPIVGVSPADSVRVPTPAARDARASGEGASRTTFRLTSFDTTWYVTNRRRDGRDLTRTPSDTLEYGFVVTRYQERSGPGSDGPLREGVDAETVDSAQMSRAEWMSRLRARDLATAGTGAGTILYVHGYAVGFGLAITQGAEIAHRGSHPGPNVVFAWPAHSTVITWPSASAIVSRAYRNDSATAVTSHAAFRAALGDLTSAVRPGTVTVAAHSMGAQLVAEALVEGAAGGSEPDANGAGRPETARLGALVFFAPDIPLARLRDSLAARLVPVAHRRIVYASDDDLLMDMSRILNKSPRAGEATAARALTMHGFEVVDVTKGRKVNGAIRKFFEPNHAMRFASSALYDFHGVVRGRSAECRSDERLIQRLPDGSWRLTDAPLPNDNNPARNGTC